LEKDDNTGLLEFLEAFGFEFRSLNLNLGWILDFWISILKILEMAIRKIVVLSNVFPKKVF